MLFQVYGFLCEHDANLIIDPVQSKSIGAMVEAQQVKSSLFNVGGQASGQMKGAVAEEKNESEDRFFAGLTDKILQTVTVMRRAIIGRDIPY